MNERQRHFCLEYIKDFNATQSAIRAGYSEKTAGVIGSENLKKPEIQEEINRLVNERADKTSVDAIYVVEKLAAIAGTSISELCTWSEGGVILKSSDELTWQQAYSVNEIDLRETIKETEDGKELVLNRTKKVKQGDKLRALELLGKHVGMWGSPVFEERKKSEDHNEGELPDDPDALEQLYQSYL